jgi:hypothetical protein
MYFFNGVAILGACQLPAAKASRTYVHQICSFDLALAPAQHVFHITRA